MNKLINNILLPIDVDHRPEPFLEQAIEIANHFQCDLHVLLIKSVILAAPASEGKLFSSRKVNGKISDAEKISIIEQTYAPNMNAGLSFRVSSCNGLAEQTILEYAIVNYIDLIVIGKTHNTMLGGLFYSLSINRLARKTQIAILTIREKPALTAVKNIVLPINGHLPMRKIMFATYVAKLFNACIHLIAITQHYPSANIEDSIYLYKTYQLLQQNTNLCLECHTVPGDNIADTTLEYAKQVKADLIIVNPGKELLLSGFINRLFARFITNESGIPVMTIAQEQPT